MWKIAGLTTLALLASTCLGGCVTDGSGTGPLRRHVYTSRGLVMPAGAEPGDWETGRNDHRFARRLPETGSDETWYEVRTWDWLRNSNGRPRDNSTTWIRSIRRGHGR